MNAAARADGGAGADGGIAVRLIVSKRVCKLCIFTAIFDARARERAREGDERTTNERMRAMYRARSSETSATGREGAHNRWFR